MAEKGKRFTSGATEDQRDQIRAELDSFVKRVSAKTGLPGEAVALEVRYWHQSASNKYRTNASTADKTRSYKFYDGRCQAAGCGEPIDRNDAVFHHVDRGVPDQHAPENLKPYHESCHDSHHGVERGSLTKGSQHSASRKGQERH